MEPQIKLVKSTKSYKITVTENLERIIRFLCDKLPRNEWSGTLFYEVEGSFEEDNLHIIAKDFYLQDVGEGAYTEFQHDATLAGYMVENDLLDCYTGLLHSHNSMESFFSGTDTSTLLSEGSTTNHFVSLIINNRGSYCAAITRKIKTIYSGNANISYNTFNNVEVGGDGTSFEFEEESVEYYNLDVIKEEAVLIKSPLELRLEELKASDKSYINRKFSNTKYPIANNKPVMIVDPDIPEYTKYTWGDNSKESSLTFEEYKREEPKQLSLFDDTSSKSKGILKTDYVTDKVVDDSIKQLLTCDIFGHMKTSNLNIEAWAINMQKLYDKRFESNIKRYEAYIENLIEFILEDVYESVNEKYKDISEFEIWSEWSVKVLNKLNTLKESEYLNYIKFALESWT